MKKWRRGWKRRERTDVIDHETRGKEESSETQEKSG